MATYQLPPWLPRTMIAAPSLSFPISVVPRVLTYGFDGLM